MTKEQFQQKVQSGILFIRPQAFWKNGVCLWRVVKYTKKQKTTLSDGANSTKNTDVNHTFKANAMLLQPTATEKLK